MDRVRKTQLARLGLYLLLSLLFVWLLLSLGRTRQPEEVSYSEFLAALRAGQVTQVQLAEDRIVARLAPEPAESALVAAPPVQAPAAGEAPPAATPAEPDGVAVEDAERTIVTSRLPGIDETELVDELVQRGVEFSGRIEDESTFVQVLIGWLPLLVIIGVYWFFMRRALRRGGGALQVGRAQPKIYDRNAVSRVTFADVAGVEEAKAELMEVVSFLRDPTKYRALGARIPKGVLLVGPPGTGKTLLARAVAGEGDAPFFSLSGSEFVEMFVGVGASRVRSLFEQAKQRAPCIIFIDELDAIGKSRGGVQAIATHDEREQTLNQLLVEMDGFDPGLGVIIMAATNRPEVLDRALLRPGRFDRQVVVDRPTVEGRHAILQVHARSIRLGGDVDLLTVARRTVGMVGADLANVVNEAALAAGRRGATQVEQRDFEEAIDRIQLGLERRGRVMTEAERRRVAYHEGGHALVALSVEHADPVHRVTIVPRSIGALGVTLQLPTDDRSIVTRGELLDRLCVMLGGRAAEEVIFGDTSTGAHNDLERATETARQMVSRFGMSETLGPVTYGRPTSARFLPPQLGLGDERTYSEETARAIDHEVRAIVEGAHERAVAILRERRHVLERMTDELLERETLEREQLEALLEDSGYEAITHGPSGERREPGEALPPPAPRRIG